MDSLSEIRKRRISLGLSLGELAQAVGRSDATISRIERGRIRPSYELVQRILTYLEGLESYASPPLRSRDVMKAEVTTVDGVSLVGEAARMMEKGGFSQLPVMEAGRVTGAVSESTLLRALAEPNGRRVHVRDVQEEAYPQVGEDFPADLLAAILTRYPAVLVLNRGELRGIVTRIDLIRGLRGTALHRSAPVSGSTGG
ncbi:MAG TPA: CBS domain-containing protein [Thermoplasmata archaeon]|nr:CBS domain-containing protein [Thermoplasmata archaeon]